MTTRMINVCGDYKAIKIEKLFENFGHTATVTIDELNKVVCFSSNEETAYAFRRHNYDVIEKIESLNWRFEFFIIT